MTFERPDHLTEGFVDSVLRPWRYNDGRGGLGLTLLVRTSNNDDAIYKTWAHRLNIAGKEMNR